MIAKRLGAIALAVILIGGAWVIRDRVIDDNGGSGNDDPPQADREIVCVEDLRDACLALADAHEDLDVEIESAEQTLDDLVALEDPSEAAIWITMAPLPAMLADLRSVKNVPALVTEQLPVASSPIALIAAPARMDVLTQHCGGTLRWGCLGDVAGEEWSEIGGNETWETVRPAFSPIDSAIGLLGVADATVGYFGSRTIVTDDVDFTRWASDVAEAVLSSSRPPDSAIATIQRRSSALDIAVGAAAELPVSTLDRFTRQYADPMIRADVVVVVPEGVSPPNDLTNELAQYLMAQGWEAPSPETNPLPSAPQMYAIREAWKRFL
jgi:hypothetical protein